MHYADVDLLDSGVNRHVAFARFRSVAFQGSDTAFSAVLPSMR